MSRLAASALAALALALAPAAPPRAAAAGPYDDLLRVVPPDSNTLVLVNVRAAFVSPLGKRENWASDTAARYKAGIGFVPPGADRVAVASVVNLSTMARTHQIGLVRMYPLPKAADLAAREGGTLSTMVTEQVVLSPRDVYLVPLPGILGVVYPADRQATARWLKYARQSTAPNVSPFFQAVADAAGDDAVTVAVDLADAADPALVRAGLAGSPTVVRMQAKVKGYNVDDLARVIGSVRGLVFKARAGEGLTGSVRLEFGAPPGPFQNTIRELFLELLADQGVALPGMENWETAVDTTSLTLSGPLTAKDLRHLLSLFAFPGDVAEDAPKGSPGEVSVAATKRYLAACDVVLGDLAGRKDDPDPAKTARWYETAATRVDQLSRAGVDPIATAAAAQTAKLLRAVAGSLRGLPIKQQSLAGQYYSYSQPNVGFGVGWWGVRPAWIGPTTTNTNAPQIREQWLKAVEEDRQKRTEAMSEIDQTMRDARRKLADKYPKDF